MRVGKSARPAVSGLLALHKQPCSRTAPGGQLDEPMSTFRSTELPALNVVGDSALATATREGAICRSAQNVRGGGGRQLVPGLGYG